MSIIYINPYQFGPAYDADAQDFINRVIAADVAAGDASGLEVGVQDAYNTFFVGCKTDGNFSALKASSILAGARTQSGAMVPLVSTMPTPTMFGTVAGWNYNRKTGLQGNGTDNYLDSNRASDADPASNLHASIYVNQAASSGNYYGVRTSVAGVNRNGLILVVSGANLLSSVRSGYTTIGSSSATGFIGNGRNSSTVEQARISGATTSYNTTELNVGSLNTFILAQNTFGTANNFADGRISFYSIGESLDLALLDARVTTLMSDLATAIP
jgi:hypothetical protein